MSATIEVLTRDSPSSEVDAAIAVFDDAFENHIMVNCFIGNHQSLLTPLNRALVGAGLVGGKVYVAKLPDVGIVAASVWFGPGEALLASPAQAEAGFNDFMGQLGQIDPEVAKWWSSFIPEYDQFCEKAYGSETYKLNGWHLQWMGVRGNYQRRGIGTSLINYAKEVAKGNSDKATHHLVLETETKAAYSFYESVNFVEKGFQTFQGADKLNTSVPMWCMAQEL